MTLATGIRALAFSSLSWQVGVLVVRSREAAEEVVRTAVKVVVSAGDALAVTATAAGSAAAGVFSMLDDLHLSGALLLEGATELVVTVLEATRRWTSVVV